MQVILRIPFNSYVLHMRCPSAKKVRVSQEARKRQENLDALCNHGATALFIERMAVVKYLLHVVITHIGNASNYFM